MDKQKIIECGVALRAVVRTYGFKNLHEFFDAQDELAETLPEDFSQDTGEYLVLKGYKEHVVRRLKLGEAPTFKTATLIYTRKPQTKGGKDGINQ